MPTRQIDREYIRAFFGIEANQEGEEELNAISEKLERLQFRNGQDICTIDGEPDGMYFLESGTAVVLDREGEQINVLQEGQYFGEYAVLSQQRRLSTVRSHGQTVVFRLSNDDMMEILRRHPNVYGELMKRVYGQVSQKHTQLLTLSRLQRGILRSPQNAAPMTPLHMLIHYGALVLVFVLSLVLVPRDAALPVFLVPLALMLAYVVITKRTVESLIVAGMLAAALVFRSGVTVGYTDALIKTMSEPDNAFTVLVMALMGGAVELIEASGAVTAFKKICDRGIRSRRGARLAMLGILAVTAIDDCLNMLCASTSLRAVSDEQRIPREETGLLLSFLPTTFCSFVPLSLWGIFVVGSISAGMRGDSVGAVGLFCRSIPFNFFSIVTVLVLLLYCFDRLPRSKRLLSAEKRVSEGGQLWPEGSERYLLREDPAFWGKLINLILPVVVLAAASLALRSVRVGSFVFDSACGLMLALVFMFFLYCAQGLMSPEQFVEHLLSGIQSMALPILLYLLTMCFSTLLSQEGMESFFSGVVRLLQGVSGLLPAALFLISTLLALALGSSWAMFVIGFPLAIRMAGAMSVSLPLCVGAVCAAGIAGEKLCIFTGDSLSVGSSIGCDPDAILAVRIPYALLFSLISLVLYLLVGLIITT